MVNEKAIRLVFDLAVLPERGGDGFALLAGVDEDQALLSAGVLKNIPHAGVCIVRSRVGFRGEFRQRLCRRIVLGSLPILHIEMFHRQPPANALGLDTGNYRSSAGAGGEEFSGSFQIANGGRKSDAAGIDTSHAAEPFDQADGLPAAVATHQGVHLVNDDKPQIVEQLGNGSVLVQQHCLQRLRRNL